jgi:Plasmid stabilization system protein
MKNKYKKTALLRFEKDLEEILDYIAFNLENPAVAIYLLDEIEEAIDKRLLNPLAFQKYYPKGVNVPHYCIRVKNYVIYYIVIGDEMELRRIFHNQRNRDNLI